MKILKNILYGFAGLFLLFFLVSIFLPSSYRVERSVTIERSPEAVYKKVARLQEWTRWNPWSRGSDSNVYRGAEMGKGAVWEWRSEKQGNGKLRIIEAEPYKMLRTRIEFKDSTITGKGSWHFEGKGDRTKVTWSTSGRLGYPVGRYMIFFVDDLIGKDLKKGLQNLKTYLEDGVRMNAGKIRSNDHIKACRRASSKGGAEGRHRANPASL